MVLDLVHPQYYQPQQIKKRRGESDLFWRGTLPYYKGFLNPRSILWNQPWSDKALVTSVVPVLLVTTYLLSWENKKRPSPIRAIRTSPLRPTRKEFLGGFLNNLGYPATSLVWFGDPANPRPLALSQNTWGGGGWG